MLLNIQTIRTEKVDVDDVIANSGINTELTHTEMREQVKKYLKTLFGENTRISDYEVDNLVCEVKVALGK